MNNNSVVIVESSEDDQILAKARDQMARATSTYSETRNFQRDDLRFYAGSPDNNWQWPQSVLQSRGAVQGQTINARPTLTINKLPQHVKQITNDLRQNRPSSRVIPVSDGADEDVAEIYNGILRHIEYVSDADIVYDTACENQVIHGEGYIRIITEYADNESFNQDLKLVRVKDSFSVYMDPSMQDPTGRDAEWCFVVDDIGIDEYKRLYPKSTPVSNIQSMIAGDESMSKWISETSIKVADYYYTVYTKKKLNLYGNGETALSGSKEDKQLKSMYGDAERSRVVQIRQVKYCKINGYEILERGDWAGDTIPVIRVVGNEQTIEGDLQIWGIIRNAKDPQRMYNYWESATAEMIALAPKAPFIGYGGQFEGYEDQWAAANISNLPYLEVNPDVTDAQGSILPLPARAQPPMASSALLQAKASAEQDIKSTTGQYNASLGMTSNERSGKAILARQREGDVGSYHYGDNLAKAVRSVARQLVTLIPKLYDVERVVRIIGEDGSVEMVNTNPQQEEPVRKLVDDNGVVIKKFYNLSVGKYDVMASSSPSYATKRQEALEAMGQLLQTNPALWQVAGDLFVKNMEWPGAQEMADRFKRTIDPKLLQNGEKSPELQNAEQQIEQMTQALDDAKNIMENMQKSLEVKQIDIKEYEASIKAYDAETKRLSAMSTGMTPQQVQEIVFEVMAGMMPTQELIPQQPQQEQPQMPPEGMQGQMQGMPQEMMGGQGMPQEGAPEGVMQGQDMPTQGMGEQMQEAPMAGMMQQQEETPNG